MYDKLYKKRLIFILLVLLFITQASTDIYVAGLPIMAKEFAVTPSAMNMTITVYVYTQAVLFLIVGPISDIVGRRKTILVGLFISLVSTFVISESSSLDAIIFFRIFQACGSAAVYIVSRLIIKEVYSKEETLKVTGLFLIGLVLSPALAPVIGAYIIQHYDWRWSFRFLGILLIIFIACAMLIIKESNNRINEYRNEFHPKNILSDYIQVLKSLVFMRNVIIVGGTFASFYAFISMSSYMYINEYHISGVYYSYLFTFIAFGYLIGNKVMTYLSQREFTSYELVKIGIVLAIFVIFMTGISIFLKGSIYAFIGLITLIGWVTRVATAFINPPIQVGVLYLFPERSSYAVGLLSALQYVCAAFGSWFVGIIPYQPSTNIIISTLVFTLISILCFYTIKSRDINKF